MIKTFRGLMESATQDTIVLHTNDGSTGYRIIKFDLLPNKPGLDNLEFVGKIYSVAGKTADATVDFSDNELLGAGYINNHTAASYNTLATVIVFDKMIFNQDIYVTMYDDQGGDDKCNYYIELEQVKLSLDESTVATLKDIRNIKAP